MRFPSLRSALPLVALLAALAPSARSQQPGTLVTYAGGANGDGLPAVSAPLLPHWLATDRDGNLLLSNGWLQRVDHATGTLTTLTGVLYNGGDYDDIQLDRTFPTPPAYARQVAVDSQNNVYFSDNYNHCVQKLGADGIPACFAGNGTAGDTGDGGPAREASLSAPEGIAFDSRGNLFIVDRAAGKVRKVDPQGVITTYAAGFGTPEVIAVDAAGSVYVTSPNQHKVYRVGTDGAIAVYAGNGPARRFAGDGGPALTASLFTPAGLAVDKDGNLLIADRDNDRIRKIDAATKVITTFAGIGGGQPYLDGEGKPYPDGAFGGDGGPATASRLFRPHGIFVEPSGRILVAEQNSSRVRAIDPDGTITTLLGGLGDGIPALKSALALPTKLAVDPQGELYIADRYDERLRKVDAQGTITTAAGNHTTFDWPYEPLTADRASLLYPEGVAVDFRGNVYFSDNGRVRKRDAQGNLTRIAGGGQLTGDNVPATSAKLLQPRGIALDSLGNLYVADFLDNRVRKVDGQGTITTLAKLERATGVAVDRHGNVFANSLGSVVLKVDPAGNVTTFYGGGPLYDDRYDPPRYVQMGHMSSVALDSEDNLYIPTYVIYPQPGMPVAGSVIKFDKDGHVSVIAGGGTEFKEGAPATEQLLGDTRDVTIDGEGNLYLSDRDNQKVYKIFKAAAPGLVAGRPIPLGPIKFAPGDVNRDGTIDVSDAILVLQSVVGMAALDAEQAGLGDLTGEGEVNISDAVGIPRLIVGIPNG